MSVKQTFVDPARQIESRRQCLIITDEKMGHDDHDTGTGTCMMNDDTNQKQQ